jgi:transposase
MTVPSVGPVAALTYRATVAVPARFRNSKAVGAVFMLYESAQIMLLVSTKWSWLKAWAMQIARRRGIKKAIAALARRLAVIMHRIWVDGTAFQWTREAAAA